ncbi:hypothetical protein PRIPAC_73408 [Pristionchus pacificus]|uniref:Uncharacterized protein n=1 Tax=Pristionchus pacificus TaxID=54126 RepID=A0A2A6B4F1_PRIPA|nr:hypothetical protein PRIPAC_73408 [Pristionchus pacificus]|eukprot:PDM60752.1 hypothetical protein PRIPAC_54558 [Pristionchus pacificus]
MLPLDYDVPPSKQSAAPPVPANGRKEDVEVVISTCYSDAVISCISREPRSSRSKTSPWTVPFRDGLPPSSPSLSAIPPMKSPDKQELFNDADRGEPHDFGAWMARVVGAGRDSIAANR